MLNHSCVPCRAKKLKCDGESPCSNCSRKGIEDDCHRAPRKARPRKSLASRTSIADEVENLASSSVLVKGIITNAAESSSTPPLSQYDTLLSLAREALGDVETCSTLINRVFFWRVLSTTYACLDLKEILDDIDRIFDDSSPRVDPDKIVLCMMVIALSWQYFPKDGSITLRELDMIDGKLTHRFRQKLLWELCVNYTRHRMSKDDHDTFAQIQVIILLLLYDQNDNFTRDQFFDHAQRSAKRIGLNTIAPSQDSLENREEETKVRAWWFLVTRSWFTSLSASSYSIHPIHFSTRLPKYLAALDEHPTDNGKLYKSVYSPLQLAQSLITLANTVRNLVDLRLSKVSDFPSIVKRQFEEFWRDLPPDYSAGAVSQRGDTIIDKLSRRKTSERWVLHQLVFHVYLELYQFHPTEPMPDACISLAHHILNTQSQVDSFCVVLNSLRLNITNIVKACSIVVLDLMQKPQRDAISRSVILAQVHQALTNCKSLEQSRPDDFQLITEMINLEAKIYGQSPGQQFELDRQAAKDIEMESPATAMSASVTSPNLFSSTPVSTTLTSSNTENTSISELSWTSFLPTDSNVYPVLQANTVEEEWEKAYETFLAMAAA